MSGDSSFGVVNGYGMEDRCSIPERRRGFFFTTAFRPALGPI